MMRVTGPVQSVGDLVSGYIFQRYDISECGLCGAKANIKAHPAPVWLCPRCEAANEAAYAAEQRRAAMADMELKGVVGPGLQRCQFERSASVFEADNAQVFRQAKAWRFDTCVFVHGPIGCGKTYLARCMLNRAYDSGLTIRETSGEDICAATSGFSARGIRHMRHPDIVLLDDLDKGKWTEECLSALLQMLDYRRNAERWSIVTCNFSPAGYLEFLLAHNCANRSTAAAIEDRIRPRIVMPMKTQDGRSLRERSNGGKAVPR